MQTRQLTKWIYDLDRYVHREGVDKQPRWVRSIIVGDLHTAKVSQSVEVKVASTSIWLQSQHRLEAVFGARDDTVFVFRGARVPPSPHVMISRAADTAMYIHPYQDQEASREARDLSAALIAALERRCRSGHHQVSGKDQRSP